MPAEFLRVMRSRDVRVLRRKLLDRFSPTSYLLNPWRKRFPRYPRPVRLALLPLVRLGLLCGFRHIDYATVTGPRGRLEVGSGCSTNNTFFNTVSGTIRIGPDTIFSHDCHVLTGTHQFWQGRRASLAADSPIPEVPTEGRDIVIGAGCFFGAAAIVVGPVTIGDNVVIAAGAVVTRDVPSGSFAAGVPARFRRLDAAPSVAPHVGQ
jgi:acetyltransferase-like isoleucine patch superfamily enzyme